MKENGVEKIRAKRAARVWLISAAQQSNLPPNKRIVAEVKRVIRRLQRDVKSLNRAEVDLEIARKAEIAKLADSQKRDAENRKLKFVRE